MSPTRGLRGRQDGTCLPTCRVNRCGDGQICSAANCGVELGTVLEACDDHNVNVRVGPGRIDFDHVEQMTDEMLAATSRWLPQFA